MNKFNRKITAFLLSFGVLFSVSSCDNTLELTVPGIEWYADNVVNEDGESITLMHSYVSLTMYNRTLIETAFPVFEAEAQRLHKLFDRDNYYLDDNGNRINNLKVINDSYGTGNAVVVDQDMIDLLKMSIEMNSLTDGYFNPTMGNLIDLWSPTFLEINPVTSENAPMAPTQFQINEALSSIVSVDDMENIIVIDDVNNTVTFNEYSTSTLDVEISLGAIAKGYAMQKCTDLMKAYETPFMVDGGSSAVETYGLNPAPSRDYYGIGFITPYKSNLGYDILTVVGVDGGTNFSTSGDTDNLYEIVDEDNNLIERHHHILNPFTGYSENYYRLISVVSTANEGILDAVSTALMNIQSHEQQIEIVEAIENYYDISIDYLLQTEVDYKTKQIEVYATSGIIDLIIPSQTQLSHFDGVFNEIVRL